MSKDLGPEGGNGNGGGFWGCWRTLALAALPAALLAAFAWALSADRLAFRVDQLDGRAR